MLGALTGSKSSKSAKPEMVCKLSYNQAQLLQRVVKKNTELFDQLSIIRSVEYTTSPMAKNDFLFDVITVDLQIPKELNGNDCFFVPIYDFASEAFESDSGTESRGNNVGKIIGFQELQYKAFPKWLYENGFYITDVPTNNGDRCRKIHFRAFLASAGMARQSQYLFCNDEVFDELIRRVSLGLITADGNDAHRLTTEIKNTQIYASKLSAYLGLTLSDGKSVKEMQTAWMASDLAKAFQAPSVDDLLNQHSVVVVDDAIVEDGRAVFSSRGPYVWTSRQLTEKGKLPEKGQFPCQKKDIKPYLQLIDFFSGFSEFVRKTSSKEERAECVDRFRQFGESRCAFELWKALIEDDWFNNRVPLYSEGTLPFPEAKDNLPDVDDKCEAAIECICIADDIIALAKDVDLSIVAAVIQRVKALGEQLMSLSDQCREYKQSIALHKIAEHMIMQPESSICLESLQSDLMLYAEEIKKQSTRWRANYTLSNQRRLARYLHLHAWYWFFALACKTQTYKNNKEITRETLEDVLGNKVDLRVIWNKIYEIASDNLFQRTDNVCVLSAALYNEDNEYPADTLFMDSDHMSQPVGSDIHHSNGQADPHIDANHKSGKGQAPTQATRIAIYYGKRTSTVYRAVLSSVDEMEPVRINLTDGCGLIDCATADALEQLILQKASLEEGKRNYSAFICRMPWIKGLLIRMPFTEYFSRQHDLVPESTHIVDIWGEKHRLSDVRIILTKSMFKGYAFFSRTDIPKEQIWNEYWKRYKEYDCSLLIAGTNSKPSKQSYLNYQFLQTSCLSIGEMQRLSDGVIEEMAGLLTSKRKQLAYFDGERPIYDDGSADNEAFGNAEYRFESLTAEDNWNEAANRAEIQDRADANRNGESPADLDYDDFDLFDMDLSLDIDQKHPVTFRDMLDRSPDLLQSRYAQQQLLSKVRTTLTSSMLGRLPVRGDVRLLVPDILFMLEYIYERYIALNIRWRIYSPINEGTFTSKKFVASGDPNHIGHGSYFAPGVNAPWSASGNSEAANDLNVALLRSPHIAVGEDAIVHPLDSTYRSMYGGLFRHLDGVVMAPYIAMSTMSGADVDGDRVNVCCDDTVVTSIIRTAEHNTSLLKCVQQERNEIIRLIKEQEDSAFWQAMLEWVYDAIPDLTAQSEKYKWAKGYCPALIFGASSNASGGINVNQLNSSTHSGLLEGALWRAFELTGKQRIGQMSLLALRYAGAAYENYSNEHTLFTQLSTLSGKTVENWNYALAKTSGEGENRKLIDEIRRWQNLWENDWQPYICGLKSNAENVERLVTDVRRWLWNWRLQTISLDTANEIDMAKTSIKTAPHRLRSPMKETRGNPLASMIDWHQSSQMYYYRQVIKNEIPASGDRKFDQKFLFVLNSAYAFDNREYALDSLPQMILAGLGKAISQAISEHSIEEGSAFYQCSKWRTSKLNCFRDSSSGLFLPTVNGRQLSSYVDYQENNLTQEERSRCDRVFVPYMENVRHRRVHSANRVAQVVQYDVCLKELLRLHSMKDAYTVLRQLIDDGTPQNNVLRLADLDMVQQTLRKNDLYELCRRILLTFYDVPTALAKLEILENQGDVDEALLHETGIRRLFAIVPRSYTNANKAFLWGRIRNNILSVFKKIGTDKPDLQKWFFNDMIWAGNAEERESILKSTVLLPDGITKDALSALTASERSIYLLQGLAGFLRASRGSLNSIADENNLTPGQLKELLLQFLGSEAKVFQYLSSNPESNDFLLMMLCSRMMYSHLKQSALAE